jgi:hypothetical protein
MNRLFSDYSISSESRLLFDLADLFEMSYDDFLLGLSEPLPNKTFSGSAGKLFRHYLKENNPIAMAVLGHDRLSDFALKLLLLSQVSEKDFVDFAEACGVRQSVLLDWSVGKYSSFDFERNQTYRFEDGAVRFANSSPELQKTLLLNRALSPMVSRLLLGSRRTDQIKSASQDQISQ